MNTPIVSPSSRRSAHTAIFLAFACILGVGFTPSANAAAAQPAVSEKAPALPVKATFEKVKKDDAPPYVLKLKNTSKESLEVSVTVLLSVMSHNRDKARQIPAHVIAAGDTYSVADLAAMDKVTVNAKGYAPLELEVK